MKHYLSYINDAIKQSWNKPALTNYAANTYTYSDVSERIERLHILFANCGIVKGDHIAICAKNSAEWCVAFLAVVTYDAVAVPLLADFLPANIVELTKCGDCKLLFVDESIKKALERDGVISKLDSIDGFIGVVDVCSYMPLRDVGNTLTSACENVEKEFVEKYPNGVSADDVNYAKDDFDALTLISYTSGTSSSPKGVMLPARSISANLEFAREYVPLKKDGSTLSILPLAHIFGLSFDFIFPLSGGCHMNILTSKPTPSKLLPALKAVNPFMFLTVPLLLEKIFRSKVIPIMRKPFFRIATLIPGVRGMLFKKVRNTILANFGTNIEYGGFFIGGAAISKDVDRAMQLVKIPYAVGYGMTECGPLISYKGWNHPSLENRGGIVEKTIELRIDSEKPATVPGEIQVRGAMVTEGYYKNEKATVGSRTEDGWFKTGDIGIRDADGVVYIKGRCKNMILTTNGQNIYPEEIEDLINQLPMVAESLVVGRKQGLAALVVLSNEAVVIEGISVEEAKKRTEEAVMALNEDLPVYSKIAVCEMRDEPFEKTPKLSIKRFLYS